MDIGLHSVTFISKYQTTLSEIIKRVWKNHFQAEYLVFKSVTNLNTINNRDSILWVQMEKETMREGELDSNKA